MQVQCRTRSPRGDENTQTRAGQATSVQRFVPPNWQARLGPSGAGLSRWQPRRTGHGHRHHASPRVAPVPPRGARDATHKRPPMAHRHAPQRIVHSRARVVTVVVRPVDLPAANPERSAPAPGVHPELALAIREAARLGARRVRSAFASPPARGPSRSHRPDASSATAMVSSSARAGPRVALSSPRRPIARAARMAVRSFIPPATRPADDRDPASCSTQRRFSKITGIANDGLGRLAGRCQRRARSRAPGPLLVSYR